MSIPNPNPNNLGKFSEFYDGLPTIFVEARPIKNTLVDEAEEEEKEEEIEGGGVLMAVVA